jgi:hypothetical protein
VEADAPTKYRRITPQLTDLLIEKLGQPCDVKPFSQLGMTWADVWVKGLLVNGIKGRSTAIREVNDRIWGKVPLPIKLVGQEQADDDGELLRAMTDEELTELEEATAIAAARERAIVEAARARITGIVDVEAREITDGEQDDEDDGEEGGE